MALRKLQAEIDRTLKSVATGVEVFEATFDKLNYATNTTQKDKLENDLKTQIKKLQRMRDQIKAWLGNGDIKDKTALLENRRLIETQMERFKALEKETKMKAFSKEGLIAQSKLDPAEKAKRDMIDWIGSTTDELSRQIEQTEAEVESLQMGKKKKQAGERLDELEELNERREWHIGRLEVVQRMLENGQLTVGDVEDIQEDVKYFLEANMEEDFDFDNGIYDELNLQDEEDFHDYLHEHPSATDEPEPEPEPIASAPVPKTPAKEKEDKKATPHRLSKSESRDKEEEIPPSPMVVKKTPSRKTTLDKDKKDKKDKEKEDKERKDLEREEKEREERSSSSQPTPSKPVPLPPIKYAAAAAAAVGGTVSASAPSQTSLSAPSENSRDETVASPDEIAAAPISSSLPPPPPGLSRSPSQAATPQVSSPGTPGLQSRAPSIGTGAADVATPSQAPGSAIPPPGYPLPQVQGQAGVMGNLMQSFEVAKEICEYECFVCGCGWGCVFHYPPGWGKGKGKGRRKCPGPHPGATKMDWKRRAEEAKRRSDDANELHAALEDSFANAPQQMDAEPPRYYHPQNPIKTPSYYPQSRLPILEDKSIYSRLELDQLFYIFYYMTGTYEQWLAARELKKQSWRFHKQYLTWFQRAHNPQAITSDYEQGGYYYFDWENSWCQRRKSDFRFEYRWLSDH
ncbi:hypothetical protein AYX15_00577 [Cryptococcus neoformans]|nr:hypothetical protein AYX15_00577 [Cryptococcus neoformans var. grubii]